MKIIAEYLPERIPPLLRLYIHYAPHRRQHRAVIQKYREALVKACEEANIPLPISHKIELWVLYINPCSEDYDNLTVALWRALDGKTLDGPSVLTDDKLVVWCSGGSYFPQGEPGR